MRVPRAAPQATRGHLHDRPPPSFAIASVEQQRWVELEFYDKRLTGRFPFPMHTVVTKPDSLQTKVRRHPNRSPRNREGRRYLPTPDENGSGVECSRRSSRGRYNPSKAIRGLLTPRRYSLTLTAARDASKKGFEWTKPSVR
ncbi:hypothetical protein EVAR_54962_1 [Eumeta japonica]|uniref:Uncharacterized protein n=1 Tax=Eumeta variegata TaxID=151549 RepID=A0A4C1YPJ2_EUMVA|nr:hypothetical protein EVAR_54962_1 [Eumeta japonica]